MTWQYVIVGIVVAACVTYALRRLYLTVRQANKCKDYRCAGCPLSTNCEKKKKK